MLKRHAGQFGVNLCKFAGCPGAVYRGQLPMRIPDAAYNKSSFLIDTNRAHDHVRIPASLAPGQNVAAVFI